MRRLAALSLIAAVPSLGAAQPSPVSIESVARGTEVRLWSREPQLSGWKVTYLGRTDTSIVVAQRSGSVAIEGFRNEIPMSRIDRIEAGQGTRWDPYHARRCVLAGAGIGALAGAVAGMIAGSGHAGAESETELAVIAFGGVGALSGMIVGGMVASHGVTVWTQVRIP